jgi:hypothetical protein
MLSTFPCSPSAPRRRTMSCNASTSCLPSKIPRSASPLRRTDSYLSLTELSGGHSSPASNSCTSVLRFIENQEKIFKQPRGLTFTSHKPSSVHATTATTTKSSSSSSSSRGVHRQRTSSPLSPVLRLLPPRPSFPRSKPEPDLYKVAIITRMRFSHGSQKTRRSHLAVSVLSAIKDLEVIVERQRKEEEGDIIFGDELFDNSWFGVSSDDLDMTL